MQNIYNQIIHDNKNIGLTPVEDLIGNKRVLIEQKLNQLGYEIKGLNAKKLAILFFSLVDILFIVKEDSFYLVTLCKDKLKDLYLQGRLINRKDETNLSKTSNMINSNTVEVVNSYLTKGKFHFIKLVPLEDCQYKSFYCRVSAMNPYPSLDKELVYTLTDVNNWYKNIVTNLTRCTCSINDTYIGSTYMKQMNYTSTSGVVFFTNSEGNIANIPIWKIKKVEPYTENDTLQKLLSGVCTFKNERITMNRDILEEYYGAELYKRLESKNLRYKYCLEEILVCKEVHDVGYYKYRYGIEEQFETVHELEKFLISNTKVGTGEFDSKHYHARKLCPPGQIGEGKKSFYITVKLNDPDIVEMHNYKDIMPKKYAYYAVNNTFGYNCVYVMSTSENTALSKGKDEFERQFGKNNSSCVALVLVDEQKLIRGKHVYKFSIDLQRELCQNIMYGYTSNYQGYVKCIRELYKCTDLKVFPSDELIQFLYINKLAKKYKNSSEVTLIDVMIYLLDFFNLLDNDELAKDKLHEAWSSLAFKRCKKEYKEIVSSYPNINKYKIEDTHKGRFIVTEFGRYKITKDGISKTVSLRYRGVELGNKRLGEDK